MHDAGRSLAQSLLAYKGRRDVVIVALTPNALSIAQGAGEILNVAFDIFLVRRISIAGNEGVTAGAVGRGAYVPNAKALGDAAISLMAFVDAAKTEEEKIISLEALYRGRHNPVTLTGTTVILVDDGTSSVEDLLVAMTAIRRHGINDILALTPLALTLESNPPQETQ